MWVFCYCFPDKSKQTNLFFPSQFIDDFTVSWQLLSRTTPEKEWVELYQPLKLVSHTNISEFVFNLVLYCIEQEFLKSAMRFFCFPFLSRVQPDEIASSLTFLPVGLCSLLLSLQKQLLPSETENPVDWGIRGVNKNPTVWHDQNNDQAPPTVFDKVSSKNEMIDGSWLFKEGRGY